MRTPFQQPRPMRPSPGQHVYPATRLQQGNVGMRPGTIQTIVVPRQSAAPVQARRLRVVLMRDVSLSMQGEKATEATQASNALLSELRQTPLSADLQCAVIDFAEDAELILPVRPITQVSRPLDPILVISGTNIEKPLRLADQILMPESGEQDVVILFSDGEDVCGSDPIAAANALKQRRVIIVTVAFGDDADLDTLQRIATSAHHHYQRSVGANALQTFLGAVGRTVTHTLTYGGDLNQTLANLT